jgi:hypothetical protein
MPHAVRSLSSSVSVIKADAVVAA